MKPRRDPTKNTTKNITAKKIAILVNPNTAPAIAGLQEAQQAADALGIRLIVLNAASADAIADALSALKQDTVDALLVSASPFFSGQRDLIVRSVAELHIPAIYTDREFAVAGGLITYGPNLADAFRQVGMYTAQVLKGTKPADLPVVQTNSFDFVVNSKTAKTLGLTIPASLLALSTEVIE